MKEEKKEETRIISKESKKKNLFNCFLAGVIGGFIFLMIYGFYPLKVTKDNWIIAKYDEIDVVQHYAGWMAFRNSDWSFPIGMADQMAVGDGTVASYVDCIPWVAILFKLVRGILPETFQYFGLYVLLSFILQTIAGYKIIYFKTKNHKYSLLGCSLLCFAPILLDRAFKHTGLASHWLILFSIYVYMKHMKDQSLKDYLYYGILEILAIGIHPYFIPMVAAFAFLCTVEDFIKLKKKGIISLGLLIFIQVITIGVGFILGTFGVADVDNSRWGYGFFSMNLNALINPTSSGKYEWSSLLKVHSQIRGNYDGFNFLGLGVILGIVLLVIFMIIANRKKEFGKKLLNNIPFLLVCFALTLFAVTNVVTFNDKILLEIELPEKILNFCGNFRGSSRLFYPVFYSILLYVVYRIYDYKDVMSKNKVYFVLGFIIFVQIFDMRYCLIQKHHNFKENMSYVDPIYNNEVLAEIAKRSDALVLEQCGIDTWIPAAWAFKNKLATYYSIAGTGLFKNAQAETERITKEVKTTGNIGKYIILTTDPVVAKQYMDVGVDCFEVEGRYFLHDGKIK